MLTKSWHYFPKCQITIFQLYHHYLFRTLIWFCSNTAGSGQFPIMRSTHRSGNPEYKAFKAEDRKSSCFARFLYVVYRWTSMMNDYCLTVSCHNDIFWVIDQLIGATVETENIIGTFERQTRYVITETPSLQTLTLVLFIPNIFSFWEKETH